MRTTNFKSGFTMIELIFVIVILGILAAIAIPKLVATKDDALVVKEVANLKTLKNDVVSYVFTTDDINMSNLGLDSLVCFSIAIDANRTMNVTNSLSTASFCTKARTDAQSLHLLDSVQL